MREVKRYDPINNDGTCGMCVEDADYGAYVEYADYAALEAECERLRVQVYALQSDANSWQSGYDKGRDDGAKAAEGWKAQHARDSAELRKLCAERDALAAELAAIKGWEPVEVVGLLGGNGLHAEENMASGAPFPLMTVTQHNRILADMRQQLAEWDAEIERLRMQLVACGVVALANTPKSASEARQMHQDYMSASCSDVANAVDREMTLRQQCDKLAELLDQTITEVGKTITPELRECIDAALAASTGQEVEK